MSGVVKLETNRWSSVEDLARWLLTHADEWDFAIVACWRREDHPDRDTTAEIETFACPPVPVTQAVGVLEMAKAVYIDSFFDGEGGT